MHSHLLSTSGDLFSVTFLYFLDHGITTRQLKEGLKADPIKRDLVLFYLMLSRAVCKIFKKLGELKHFVKSKIFVSARESQRCELNFYIG